MTAISVNNENSILPVVARRHEAGTSFYAKATYLHDPHHFTVVPIPEFYQMSALNIAGLPVEYADLYSGLHVVYVSPRKNHKIRGQIVQCEENESSIIYATDYGFRESVPLNKIYFAAGMALKYPSLCVHCELAACVPTGGRFTQNDIDSFKDFMGAPYERLKIVVNKVTFGKLIVTVYNSNIGDVATLMAFTNSSHMYF